MNNALHPEYLLMINNIRRNVLATTPVKHDVTESCVLSFAGAFDAADVDMVIDMMMEAGELRSTVIDGGARFGFVPGVQRTGDAAPTWSPAHVRRLWEICSVEP